MNATKPIIQASSIRQLREDISSVAPDGLSRFDLLQVRGWYIRALRIWESEVEDMLLEDKSEAVASTSIPELARTVARGVFALAFPAALFSIIAGASAALAVASFRFVLNLFY